MMTISQNLGSSSSVLSLIGGKAMAFLIADAVSLAEPDVPQSFYDSNLLIVTGVETWNEYDVQLPLGSAATIEVERGSISLDGNRVSPLENGSFGSVRISERGVSNILNVDCIKRSDGVHQVFLDYEPGSVSSYLRDQVESLLTENPETSYFSTYVHATQSYQRNPACWLADVDLSAVAVASNSGNGWFRQRGGTLITPRHALLASHYNLPIGSSLRFADSQGNVQTVNVVGTAKNINGGDLFVAALSEDVSVASPMEIAGEWMKQGESVSGSAFSYYTGGAAVFLDQLGKAYACGVGQTRQKYGTSVRSISINGNVYSQIELSACVTHSQEVFTGGIEAPLKIPVPGDSGQPVMLVIEGSPVLLFCFWTFSEGPPVWKANGAILNDLIALADASAGINTGYTVTVAPDPTA